MHRPVAVQILERQVDALLERMQQRQVALPAQTAMHFTLNALLEYKTFETHDPAVLLASADDRLGRKIHDVLPSGVMALFDRAVHTARKTLQPSHYVYSVRDVPFRTSVFVPSADTVIVNVARVVGSLLAPLAAAGMG